MKTKTIIMVMAAASVLSACGSESTPVDNGREAVSFTGGIKGTRVSGTSWAAGDLVGITAKSSTGDATDYANEEYTTDKDGVFSYKAGKEIFYEDANPVDFTAYYPFSSTFDKDKATTIDKTIAYTDESTTPDKSGDPTPQSQIDYLWATKPAVAKGSQVSFTFSHEMSELTFKFIPDNKGVTSISTLTYDLGGVLLTGTFDTSAGTAVATSGSTTGALTGMTSTVAGDNTSASSTLILFPSAAQKASLTVTMGGNKYTASSVAIPAMSAGKNYEIDVTLSNTGLSFSASTIGDWASGGSATPITVTM